MIIKRSISVSLLTSMQAKIAFRWLGVAERVICTKDFLSLHRKKHERGNGDALCTHKRDCALHDVLCCDFVATRAEQSSHLH